MDFSNFEKALDSCKGKLVNCMEEDKSELMDLEIHEVARNLENWVQDSLPGSLPGSQGPIEVDNSSAASSKGVSSTLINMKFFYPISADHL